MPKEKVARHCDPNTYAAIGQLYSSTLGINYLVRNLLANPHIRWLVSLGVTKEDANSGSVKCLADFFTYGVTDDGGSWKVNSTVLGYIDKQIPLVDLETLRERIVNYQATEAKAAGNLARLLSEHGTKPPNCDPKVYPITLPRSVSRPATLYGQRIEAKTVAEGWLSVLDRIRGSGILRTSSYGGQVQELIDLVVVVDQEPSDYFVPTWFPFDREYLTNYLAHVLEDSDVDEGVEYTYGQRIRSYFHIDQVKAVVTKLKSNRDDASAVISLWDVKVDSQQSRNRPCLNTVWVRIIGNCLTLTATFRSNDMYSAWPANAMSLIGLQREIRDLVDPHLELGALVTLSQSAHIYDDAFEAADLVLANHYQGAKVTYDDKVGNFLIEVVSSRIEVTQMHPSDGTVVEVYSSVNPLALMRKVVASNPTITAAHAGYLGLELQKAALLGTDYAQDK